MLLSQTLIINCLEGQVRRERLFFPVLATDPALESQF